jgi:PqqD family protein of HPr-rel-A system
VRFDDSEHWVVNFPAAGQTHLLTDAGARLWHLVPERGGATAAELCVRLATDLRVPLDDAFRRSTEETLGFFDRVGLIEPSAGS